MTYPDIEGQARRRSAETGLVYLSKWVDAHNRERLEGLERPRLPYTPAISEAATSLRLTKLSEEVGEVMAAWIGVTGQNPRKGVTHDVNDVLKELLDVAITALGAWEHLTGHTGLALRTLEEKIISVAERAIIAAGEPGLDPLA